jgi:hypothetical protein
MSRTAGPRRFRGRRLFYLAPERREVFHHQDRRGRAGPDGARDRESAGRVRAQGFGLPLAERRLAVHDEVSAAGWAGWTARKSLPSGSATGRAEPRLLNGLPFA